MKNLLLLIMLVFFLSSQGINAQSVGDNAPDFSLDMLNGGTFTLSEQDGKVVLIFVFGYSCPACISGAPTVENNVITPYLSYNDFVAIGIDIWDGSSSAVQGFKDDSGLGIPLLMNGGNFAVDYNTIHDRLIVIDKDGKIAHKNNGAAGSSVQQVIPVLDAELGLVNSLDERVSSLSEMKVYPNPAVDAANLSFELQQTEDLRISLHAFDGRLIEQIFEGELNSGTHQYTLDLDQLSPGMYFAHLAGKDMNEVVRIVKR